MRHTLLAIALALPAFSQDAPRITRIVELHSINAVQYGPIITAIGSDRFSFSRDTEGKTVVLKGPQEEVDAIERFLKKMDAAPIKRSVEVTIYMMLGLTTQDGQAKLPAELTGVATQLRGVFGFKDFRLVETTVLRVREGSGGESSGVFPDSSPGEAPSIYQTKFAKLTITGEPPARTMRLDFFRFGGRLASKNAKSGEVQYIETGVNTDVDVREGQKAVVGKANFGGGRESLFIVLTAKIVD